MYTCRFSRSVRNIRSLCPEKCSASRIVLFLLLLLSMSSNLNSPKNEFIKISNAGLGGLVICQCM